MTKTQLKALATQIHGLAVKSANGKKATQSRALEKIAALLNQAIETAVKQAYTDMATQIRGLAEKLAPSPRRKATGKKQGTRKKPVAAKRKPQRQGGRAKPTEEATEPPGTPTP